MYFQLSASVILSYADFQMSRPWDFDDFFSEKGIYLCDLCLLPYLAQKNFISRIELIFCVDILYALKLNHEYYLRGQVWFAPHKKPANILPQHIVHSTIQFLRCKIAMDNFQCVTLKQQFFLTFVKENLKKI